MLNINYTAKILNLEDVKITNVENTADALHIYLELPRKAHTCPCCSAATNQVHDYRMQTIKDIPLGRTTYLHLRKRRYRCPECGKRFAEDNAFLPRCYRMTSRLVASMIDAFRKVTPATEIAAQHNVSVSTALRCFDLVSYQPKELPAVLSIDEFKGNAGRQKYQSILTNPEKKEVLDILPNRFEHDLISYFRRFPSRKDVKYFITDMNPHFRSVAKAYFPNATIVADKYHVVRQSVWAMERVRKNEQKKLAKRYRVYFKRSRYLLNKPREKLTVEDMNRLALMFEIAPRLADAYRLKNEFISAMRAKSSLEGRELLLRWLESLNAMELPEFDDCEKACRNWFQEILNSFDVPWTNGFTEGCNNKTKVLKRVCYGARNFERFRNRILHCAS
ncbi:MAG: ISL3 family transposase [Clostridiales bacterium]|nr:ISL3 family transposase [Clostridiales bacterium]